jgi:hypothetical protein
MRVVALAADPVPVACLPVCCIVCSIWACIINTCSSVGGGHRLAFVVVVVIVLVGTTVESVGHLMIVKRFEIEVKDRDTRFWTICIKV